MSIQLKPMESIASKWQRRAGAAGGDYQAGVAAPKRDWAAATVAADAAYQSGVQEAIGAGRFAREVRKAGSAKWQNRAATLGVPRYSQGVQQAAPDYAAGFGPYAQVLSQLTLPEKAQRGAAQNLERVRAVADALHQRRVSQAS